MNEFRRKTKCFLFTLFYPYTHQGVSYDSYISSEIEKITDRFDEVHVIAMGKEHDGSLSTCSNLSFENYSADLTLLDKILSARFFLSSQFWAELTLFKRKYSGTVSMNIVKSLLLFLAKAEKYKQHLKTLLVKIDFSNTEVCIYNYWTFENSLAAIQLKQDFLVKVFTRMHSLDLYFDRVPENYLPFRKLIYEKCDKTFFISEQGRNYFNRIHQIEPSQLLKGVLNRIGVKNEYAIRQLSFNKIVLLSNAWVQPLKRIELIAEGLSLINDFDIEWIHIGDDYGTNRFSALKKNAGNLLDTKKNVRYEFVGRQTQAQVYEIFAKREINLFINVSTTEGTPVSIIEAQSFGVPVIATNVGGVPEIIVDKHNGFLLSAELNAKIVAEKISEYYRLSEYEKLKMSNNARNSWNKKFNADLNSRDLVKELYG